MSKIIEISNLTKLYKTYNHKVKAIEAINLEVEEGDFLSIVGPSGAGKSTLLHSIGGILAPDKGKVLYKGSNIYKQRERKLANWRNKNVGFVFQFYYLIEELNILENVALAGFRIKKKYSLQRAHQLLEYFGIRERSDFYPSQLSGGQKQKVAIARALMNKPELLLCDEPTGNLDQESQAKIEILLKKINQEDQTTIILVTHNTQLAATAKDTMLIEAGRLRRQK
ncbi:MAG: ABC transporter ATP-binding protein [Candidatus Omnitrophica bacterium]|nr:ABC transporter ATP-binding protein [Candidatus Omnitrophota bacterium]